jgi:hypothetical protein
MDGELLVELDVAGAASQLGAPQPKRGVTQITNLVLLQVEKLPSEFQGGG